MNFARDTFLIAAHRLSHASPQIWREFEAAFAVYVTHQVEAAVRAPATNALTAHGAAQMYLALRDDFQDIDQLYHKIAQKLDTQKSR